MNYKDYLIKFISKYPDGEPITTKEIQEYFKKKSTNENVNLKSLNVYINRLEKNNIIKHYEKGIYYKPKTGILGPKSLNKSKIIRKKYLYNNKRINGYYSGAYLYNKLGLTTQVPKDVLIITNACPNKNKCRIAKLNVCIKKPKIKINNNNYLYLQLLDVLENKEKIKFEKRKASVIIKDFIKQNKLNYEKIFKYAKETNNKKAVDILYDLI